MLNNPTFRIDLYGLSRGAYCYIIHTYPALPICVLYSLQGQFKGFQDFTLLLNSESDIPAFPKYMLSKPLSTVTFLGILKKSLSPLKRINH